ncbi:SMP-30/gluconolactonase/LRE family protein [Sphingomonas sp. M6A6_1c]
MDICWLKPAAASRHRTLSLTIISGSTAPCGTFSRASKYPFENAIKDYTRRQEVREREFAKLDVPATATVAATGTGVAVTAGIRKLADGFYSIAGGAVDASGKLYFIDRFHHRIHGWSQEEGLSLLTDTPLDPVNLAVGRSGNVMVLSSAGTDASVYSIDPAHPEQIRTITATPARRHSDAATLLPVNIYANGEFADRLDPKTYAFPPLSAFFVDKMADAKSQEYVSPDGSLVLPAFRVWNQSTADNLAWRWPDSLDAYGLVAARQGERVVLTNSSENRTYSGLVGIGGQLTDLKVVADRGGESVARDNAGNLYVANGQVFVYGADGEQERRIDTPERPLQLLIGGKGKRTLFILTHHALYAMSL